MFCQNTKHSHKPARGAAFGAEERDVDAVVSIRRSMSSCQFYRSRETLSNFVGRKPGQVFTSEGAASYEVPPNLLRHFQKSQGQFRWKSLFSTKQREPGERVRFEILREFGEVGDSLFADQRSLGHI